MITAKDVAKTAGVSPKTAANILGSRPGQYSYSVLTSQKVRDAAKHLGYRPNNISRALQRRRSNLIGIVSFGSVAEIARKTQEIMARHIHMEGFDNLTLDLNWLGGDMERAMDALIQSRVEGVIVSHMTGTFGPQHTAMLKKVGIPAVTVNGSEILNIPLVADDARTAFRDITHHLLSLGHRRIVLLVGDAQARPECLRIEGFQQAMKDFSAVTIVEEATLIEARSLPWMAAEGGCVIRMDVARHHYSYCMASYHTMKTLLKMDNLPDAIVCFNDLGAFGVFAATGEANLRIPSDLAVTGCDNDLYGQFPVYGLTTIEKDVEATCSTAMKILIERIRGKKSIERHLFPSTLILRTSCGRSPTSAKFSPNSLISIQPHKQLQSPPKTDAHISTRCKILDGNVL